jgi:hypothetical protein
VAGDQETQSRVLVLHHVPGFIEEIAYLDPGTLVDE